MKIAFFLDTFPILSETFIRNQITGLIDLGHHVTIFCHPSPEKEAWEIEDVKKYQLNNTLSTEGYRYHTKRNNALFLRLSL